MLKRQTPRLRSGQATDYRREKISHAIRNLSGVMLFFGALSLASCSGGTTPNNADTATTTTQTQQDNVNTQSLSVTPPNSPVPKQAADSIWEGDYIEKYPNGVIKKRGYVKGGLASGEWVTFYDDGKPYSRGTYHAGYRIGYGVSWYHNGEKSSEGYYNQGKMVGKWKYWSEEGHQLVEKDYGGVMPDTSSVR